MSESVEISESVESKKPGWKKKKRSFIQKAKKFGRQGQRGKGTDIPQDQYDYFVRVLERWRDGFETEEDKSVFVENVFQQTEGEETTLCGNQLASRVIELLLPHSSEDTLERFRAALSSSLRQVCTDQFSSHVLESLLLLTSFSCGTASAPSTEAVNWLVKVCKFCCNNISDFSCHTYASHLLRTSCQCLTGHRLPEGGQGQRTEGYSGLTVWRLGSLTQLEEVVSLLVSRVCMLGAEELGQDMAAHTVISVIRTLAKKQRREVVRHLLATAFPSQEPGSVDWSNNSLVRLMEAIIETEINSSKLGDKIYSLLSPSLGSLSSHPSGNFLVQRLLSHLIDKERLESLLSLLLPHLEDILAGGCPGVLLALASAARREGVSQAPTVAALHSALHTAGGGKEEASLLAPCLASLVTREVLQGEGGAPSVHLQGSLALQQLLHFSKPIQVVRSLLAMPAPALATLLSDPRGCHVTDAFMQSTTVGEKSREGLVRALKEQLAGMACSKHGSRSIDTLWKFSSIKMKAVMAESMSYKIDVLNSNKFGKFVSQNLMLSVFKRSKEDWKNLIEKKDNVKNMFSEIIGEKEAKSIDVKPLKANELGKDKISDKKKNVSEIVDDWLKSPDTEPPLKKKKKGKSYLDDL